MSKSVDLDFVLRVLRVFSESKGPSTSDLWWRTDDPEYGPVSFFANCNDLFFWGSADCEDITPGNIHVLEQAVADMRALDLVDSDGSPAPWRAAHLLFCARVRGERPQGAYYSYIEKEYWPLFDAAGPARETGFGNPYHPGAYKPIIGSAAR